MCGITALYNVENAPGKILDLIVQQEHRGRDATGIAYIDKDHGLVIVKKAVPPSVFKGSYGDYLKNIRSKICIGHNRLASTNHQNKDKDEEAHPFMSEDGSFALVHNGTFTGYEYMAHFLDSIGHKRSSGTDTEIFVHILEELLKRYPRDEAIRRFYRLSEGNILILFADGVLYGIPGRSFYVLITGKSLLVASESRTFTAFDSLEDSKLYIPGEGSLLKVGKKVELIGEWEEVEFKKDGWIYSTETSCDFCGARKPCEKFYINTVAYDRCYDCYKENKTVPRYRRNTSLNYGGYRRGGYLPSSYEDDEEDEDNKEEYGICSMCKKKFPIKDIIICSICRRSYCTAHIEVHDCEEECECLEVNLS